MKKILILLIFIVLYNISTIIDLVEINNIQYYKEISIFNNLNNFAIMLVYLYMFINIYIFFQIILTYYKQTILNYNDNIEIQRYNNQIFISIKNKINTKIEIVNRYIYNKELILTLFFIVILLHLFIYKFFESELFMLKINIEYLLIYLFIYMYVFIEIYKTKEKNIDFSNIFLKDSEFKFLIILIVFLIDFFNFMENINSIFYIHNVRQYFEYNLMNIFYNKEILNFNSYIQIVLFLSMYILIIINLFKKNLYLKIFKIIVIFTNLIYLSYYNYHYYNNNYIYILCITYLFLMLDVKLKEINFNKQKYILFGFIILFLLIFLITNLKNNKEITTDFLKTKYINYILKEKELEVYKNSNYSIYNSYNKKEQEIIVNDKTSYKYSKNYYTLYDDKNNILFDSFSKKENKELINKKIINSLDNNNLIFVKNYYLKEYNIEKIYFQISINIQIEDKITKIYFNKQLFELEKMKDEKRKIILKILNSKDVIPIHKNFF